MLRLIAAVLTLSMSVVVGVVVAGVAEPPVLVTLAPLGLFLFFSLFFDRLLRRGARDVARATELRTRGLRRTGRVRDAIPYASRNGGAVLRDEGALMVLDVELEGSDGTSPERVRMLVVENSERSRARIGQPIVVLQHPENPQVRAVEDFEPDGQPIHY